MQGAVAQADGGAGRVLSSGVDDAAVEALFARIEREVDDGLVTAAQIALARDGEVLAHRAFGAATEDSRFVIFSATKALVAMALVPHIADGSLELTRPVADYIPEFGEGGKERVGVLQLLTMQGGFPYAPMHPRRWGTSEGRRAAFASWTLDWPAGSRTEYHPIAAHWVIAELIEELSRRPYADVIHERISAPAGVEPLLGARTVGDAAAHRGPIMPVRTVGEHPGIDDPRLVELFSRTGTVPAPVIGADLLLFMNDPRSQAAGIPGGGGIARARDIAAVYQTFLDGSPGRADAIGTLRNVSRGAIDGLPANRTVAGVVAGHDGLHDLRWFPAAPRAFGHHGAGGQLCWVDPDTRLSVCFLHDTLDQDPRNELARCTEVNSLALRTVRS